MKMFEGKKFLVVDDDEMLRETIGDVFRRQGAKVTEAEDGVAAFALVQMHQFDVVFADIRMSAGDGVVLAKNIFELPGERPLVFICSGFCDISESAAAQYKIAKVFEKPFENSEIVQVIFNHLSKVTKHSA